MRLNSAPASVTTVMFDISRLFEAGIMLERFTHLRQMGSASRVRCAVCCGSLLPVSGMEKADA